MKKILLLLSMMIMLSVAVVGSAANSRMLEEEDAIAQKFINGGSYNNVASVMTEEMKNNWDEKAYSNYQAQMGKVTFNKLRIVQFLDDVDVLTYQVVTDKVPVARYQFVFKQEKGKLVLFDFGIGVPQDNAEPKAETENK